MATIQENIDYMIVNYNSGLVWAVRDNQPAVGNSIIQFNWVINPHQFNHRWNFVKVVGGWQIRTSLKFGELYAAIDKNRASAENCAGINIYPSEGLTRQIWALSSDQVGEWISINNVNTQKCCNVLDASTANSAYIIQYDCSAQASQRWMIVPYITGM